MEPILNSSSISSWVGAFVKTAVVTTSTSHFEREKENIRYGQIDGFAAYGSSHILPSMCLLIRRPLFYTLVHNLLLPWGARRCST
jgi:hypothetical protein